VDEDGYRQSHDFGLIYTALLTAVLLPSQDETVLPE